MMLTARCDSLLDPGAAAALEDKVLDVEIEPEGEIRFGLFDRV